MGTLVLAGRYEIIEKIGDGGMAVVYKARDKQLNRFVALKILKKEFITDQTFVENFIREAKAAASLLHPNIVTIYDAGKDRDIYYIVMEYVEGRALSDVIAAEAPLDYKRCIRIAKQIASALSLAHRNNIIHRDVKPHNILITQDGTAKITDFGIAKAVSDGTIINDNGMIMGSVHYFSPEQSRGQYVDEKSDIYSLGIVLYEMITSRVPFDADNPVTIAVMHMNDSIIPPSRLVRGVPPGLDQIVLKATAKYQSDRFRTIDEMYKALDNVNFITGVIDDPEIAGYVKPVVIVDEKPGQGYSAAAEPEPYHEPEVYAASVEAPDYRSGSPSADDDDLYDDYDDDEKKPGILAGFFGLFGGDKDEDGTGDPEQEQQGRLTKKQKLILLIAIVALAIVLSIPVSGAIRDLLGAGGDPVEVPAVVGLYEEEAIGKLQAAGFSVEVEPVPLPVASSSSPPEAGEDLTAFPEDLLSASANTTGGASSSGGREFSVGQVMEQDPEGGEMANPGTKVRLKVAAAPASSGDSGSSGDVSDDNALGEPTKVPDLIGKTKANAEYAIQEAGFKIGSVGYENSELPIDQVINQSPKKDEMVPKNSVINIVISLGPKETNVTVPKFVGSTLENATAAATANKIKVNNAQQLFTRYDAGLIYEQNPAEGTSVKEGSTVNVGVSLGSVPVVEGLSAGDAEKALRQVGLKYARGGDEEVDDESMVGKVIRQSAKTEGDTRIEKGTTITCTIGKAKAEAPRYTLTVSGGTVSGSSGGETFEAGQQISISAVVPAGQEFTNWTSDNGGSFATVHSANTTFTMPAGNVTVTANFKAQQFTVTVTNGTGGGTYKVGDQVTIVATVTAGQVFNGWDISGASGVDLSLESTTFTMPPNAVTATAKIGPAPTPPTSPAPEGGGTP